MVVGTGRIFRERCGVGFCVGSPSLCLGFIVVDDQDHVKEIQLRHAREKRE